MTEQQQEQLESLTSSLQAKEREIEQLKYDLIVSLFLIHRIVLLAWRRRRKRGRRW